MRGVIQALDVARRLKPEDLRESVTICETRSRPYFSAT
jgi:hypothetical protein